MQVAFFHVSYSLASIHGDQFHRIPLDHLDVT